jgi:hypothetical protein
VAAPEANGMGRADLPLQHSLAANCFYTEGVRLVTEGSPVLALLGKLEA